MKRVNSSEIAEQLKRAQKVAIFGHVSPDTDCYGSAIGLKMGLESEDKEAYVYLPEEMPYNLVFLNNYGSFQEEKAAKDADLAVVLDCSSVSRAHSADMLKYYKNTGVRVVLIDHHLPGDLLTFADMGWQDEKISSVSEMILAVLKEMRVNIQKGIATYLLAGIEGDTSSFQNQNTTQSSFEAAAYLMSKGARFGSIISNTINSKRNLNLIKLYGLALERVIYNKKYKTATTYITLEDLKKYELDEDGSYSEMINYLNTVNGIKMIVLITEKSDNELKVSLRTRDDGVNVQVLAKALGGGGHAKASGFSLKGRIANENGKIKICCL